MYTLLVDNSNYQVAVDQHKNRLYIKIIGFWRNKEQVPQYVQDVTDSVRKLKYGFTLLADLSEMKTHPVELAEVHLAAQKVTVDKGIAMTAEIINSSFVQFQTQNYSKKSTMQLKQFISKADGEAFLDSLIPVNETSIV